MSAVESDRVQDVVEHRASVTLLPGGAVVEPKPKRVAKLAELFTPPDIWSEDRPSLRKIWLYARYGRWTRESGALRVLGVIDAFGIVLPFHAVGYLLLWIVERQSRRYIFAALVTLAILAF